MFLRETEPMGYLFTSFVCLFVYYKEFAHIIMEVGKFGLQSRTIGWRPRESQCSSSKGDRLEETVFQMRSKGSVLVNSLLLRRGSVFLFCSFLQLTG